MKKSILIFLSFINFFLFFTEQPFGQYVIRKWEKDEGLPQNSINSILQSKDGYIWIGTQEGLVRFDGLNFTIFDKNNTKGIPSNHILSIVEDEKGILWIGTFGGGIFSFSNGIAKSYYHKENCPFKIVRSLFLGRDGVLWIGTEGEGLWTLKNGIFNYYKLLPEHREITIRAIYKDHQGNLWVGTENFGLFKLKGNKIENITTKNGLPDNNVYCIFEDNEGNIWVGTGDGLARFFENEIRIFSKAEGLTDNFIQCIYQNKIGILWIGTNSGGLNYYVGGKFFSIGLKDGLSHNNIYSLYEDKEGNLWVGTNGGGLNQLKKGKVRMLRQKEGLKYELVWTILKARDGRIWIGTSAGLFYYKDGRIFDANLKNLQGKNIWSLFYSKDESLWVGTYGNGLVKIKDNGSFYYTTKDGLPNNVISSIQEDKEGNLFIGTRGGLSIFKKGKFHNYSINDGLPSDAIYALYYDDSKKVLWIGTREGLCKMEDQKFHCYKIGNEFLRNMIISFYEDKEGALWIGTYGSGLIRFKDDKFTIFSKKDGFCDDAVFQILEDRFGNFWMSSNNGIFSISRRQLEDLAKGRLKKISCKSLGPSDGLISTECNGGSQPAGIINDDGKIWFPTIKGVAIVDPSNLSINKVIPPVIIEKLKVNDVFVDLKGERIFGPGSSKLEFQYTALSFTVPEKVLFKYKLEGFEDTWTEAGNRRIAYYTNIPPGKYVFKVIACNNDGIWNQKGASLSFELKPHFYETLWFRSLLIILFILSLFLIFLLINKARLRIVEAESMMLAERNKIAQEIHDTIAQGLQGLCILLQSIDMKAGKENSEINPEIKKAYSLAKETLQEARYSISALQSSFKQIFTFPEFLKTKIEPLFLELKIKLIYEVLGKPYQLAAMEEYNLMRIVQEAVRNAIKHSMAKNIKVALKYEPFKFYISIIDDGKGFDLNKINASEESGFGIFGMKERAKQIGADFLIKSEINKGTSIEILLNFKSRKRN